MASDIFEPSLDSVATDQNGAMDAARAMKQTRLGFEQCGKLAHPARFDRKAIVQSTRLSNASSVVKRTAANMHIDIDAATILVDADIDDIFFA